MALNLFVPILLGLGLLTTILLPLSVWAQDYDDAQIKGRIQYQQGKYLLGPGDVISLKVLHEPEYSQGEILVRPDGYASFPGVGEMYVANDSVESMTAQVVQALKETIIEPEVVLTVKNIRPGTVYISGAVEHPGMFQFTSSSNDRNVVISSDDTAIRTDMRVSNILYNAGGVSLDADLTNVSLTRADSGEIIHLNLWKVLNEGAVQEDVWVSPGDYIHVPRSATLLDDESYQTLLKSPLGPKNFPVRVVGEVNKPGVYKLEGSSPYLATAVASAGGFAKQATRDVVAIRRFSSDNQFSTLFVEPEKLDMMLRPNDVVFVGEKKLYKAGRFGEEARRILSPFTNSAMAASSLGQIFGWGFWDRNNGVNN